MTSRIRNGVRVPGRVVAACLSIGAAAWISSAAISISAAQPKQNRPQNGAGQAPPTAPQTSQRENGATYYRLEAETGRVTIRFVDGGTAASTRDASGAVDTVQSDVSGNELGRTRHPFGTLADAAHGGRPDADVAQLVTEWTDGLTATLTRGTVPRVSIGNGRFVEGQALLTVLRLNNGVEVGRGVWFPRQQAYGYFFPQLMTKMIVITPDNFNEASFGFTPDAAWLNLQTLALYRFRSTLKAKGTLAKNGMLERVVQFFAPTLHANDPGCDSLHWWDGTVLRQCCDQHDRCYEAAGCTYRSWWRFGNWSCTACNVEVVQCFVASGVMDAGCILMRLSC